MTFCVIFWSIGMDRLAQAQMANAEPDLKLAYVLATASFCANTVGDGSAAADNGQKKAFECLHAAADKDPALLGKLKINSIEDVEAYVAKASKKDAYLLVNTEDSVILAFRGTLTPPISPSTGSLQDAVSGAKKAAGPKNFANSLQAFLSDWVNDTLLAFPNAEGRHHGFDSSWKILEDHLSGCPQSPSTPAIENRCSRFLTFIQSKMDKGNSHPLYITGHSKGGAIATLAVLDIHGIIGDDIKPIAYTFEAAKSLTSSAAAGAAGKTEGLWRFELEGDIVPLLPADGTIIFFPGLAYSPVGHLAYFEQGPPPHYSTTGTKTLPEDKRKAINFVASLKDSFAKPDVLKEGCRHFVDSHFAIFSVIQELVRAHDPDAREDHKIAEINSDKDFFARGLPDDGGRIMWGYAQWCGLL